MTAGAAGDRVTQAGDGTDAMLGTRSVQGMSVRVLTPGAILVTSIRVTVGVTVTAMPGSSADYGY